MAFTATIPDTTGNPFIKQTSLPEGTLFIAVGSILLGFIVLVVSWRAYEVYVSYRSAAHNEARFHALEPSYGGPFRDPVQDTHEEVVKPAKFRRGKLQAASVADRATEAHLMKKFFSPTTEVLLHGTVQDTQPVQMVPQLPSGFYDQKPARKVRPPSAYLDDLLK